MVNENYRKSLKDIHTVRRIMKIPEFREEEFSDIEKYLDYLAENEYSLGWAEVRSDKLFPYERRTIVKLLEKHLIIPSEYFSVESVKQYLCPCCQAMTQVNMDISRKNYSVTVTYLPPNWRSNVQRFIGKNLTMKQMIDFPGVNESAELREVV